MKTTTLTISNPISDSLLRCALILIPFVLICVATLPGAHAVSPPAPGGYPNFTTAAGDNALQALTLGVGNTAIGTFSLFSVTTGNFNTALGAGALDLNTADQNTATGAAALLFNTTGTDNTANGAAALESNDTGSFNTANGALALLNNTTGLANTASGVLALENNTIGSNNTADGEAALENSTGNHNTAIGDSALRKLTAGSENTALGALAGINVTTADRVICIGTNGANVSNACFIGNIRDVQTQNADTIPVLVDSAGQLGTQSSSRRFKKEIKSMDSASEGILALKPVTFQYKSDKKNAPRYGLIAEEVAKVNPDLVVRDKNGEIYTVRYEAVNAMLLNEFLKEHGKVEQQQAAITQLESAVAQQRTDFQATLAQLTARLDKQAAQIQKVSAQFGASKPAPQVVNNP